MEQNPDAKSAINGSKQVDDASPVERTNARESSRAANLHAGGVDLTGIFKQITPAQGPSRGPASTPGSESGAAAQSATNVLGVIPSQQNNSEPGFTQVFRAMTESETAASGSLSQPPTPVRKEENVMRQAGEGEFTQLFRRLDSGSESNKQDILPSYSDHVPPVSPETRDGGFTQLLRTLSTSNEVDLAPSRPQPAFKQDAEGPGEFTRIMSRSNLPEAQQSTPAETASNTPEQPSASGSRELPSSSSPQTAFASPQIASNSPGNPFASIPAANSTPSSMPIAQPAHMPAIPGSSAEQKAGKLQEYLPLLLISNIFLSLITLIFVVCLLLRRH